MKSDIWALGCILFELVSGRKAFANDFAVFRYIEHKKKPEISLLTDKIDKRLKCYMDQLIHSMLELEWETRPTARDVLYALRCVTDKNSKIFAFRDPMRRSFQRVILPPQSEKWDTLQWKPMWYVYDR